MDNYSMLFNIITLLAGGFCLYTVIRLKKSGELFPNQLLIPKDAKPEECIDPEGYIPFISLRLLVLGLTCVLTSALCMVNEKYGIISDLFPQIEGFASKMDLVCNGLCLAVLVWYMVCWIKARKEYWV